MGAFRRFAGFLVFAIVAALRPSSGSAHVDDPSSLLPLEIPAAENLETKLATFERVAGVRILVRLHGKSPSAQEDAQPGAFMRALAGKLGVAQRGVLAVYFADEDDWRVWIGDDLTPTFVGRAGTARELTASGAIHDAKEAFFVSTRDASDAAFAALQKSAPERQPSPTHRIKLQADAIVDGLIARLGAHISTSALNPP